MIKMKKASIENRILAVVSHDDLMEHPEMYANSGTGIEFSENGIQYILPYRTGTYTEDRPGVYNCGPINRFVLPKEEESSEYVKEVIDLSNVENISELSKKMELLKNMEREILTSPDNIFTPIISDKDSPEMRGLKEAVIAKNIDIDKYAGRFGDNFPNDKRQFKKNDITLFMMKRMCDCLDMKARLIIEDSSPDVPNPIGRDIVIDLIGGYEDDQ